MKEIISEKIIFDHGINVSEAIISDNGETYQRQRVNRPDASCVLLYNRDSGRMILLKQFRYAVRARQKEELLEIVAGKLDAGETPEEAAVRECLEETGYAIKKEALSHVASCFVSPGYSTERFHIYYAEAGDADKAGKGGGIAADHEGISLAEISRVEFRRMMREGKIGDAKTCIAGFWHLLRFPD
jgi:nudix-type nucleoside diphosphatase (YffH/AdpP family)